MPRYLILGVGLLALGCSQSLNDERSVNLTPGNIHTLTIDGPKKEQKVSVAVTSPGVPTNVYVVLAKDQEAAEASIDRNQKPANTLASQEKTEAAALEATIPAKSSFAVILTSAGAKSGKAQVKITGK